MRLLDDGMSTPLHYRVCDQKGLAYHVSAGLEPLHDAALVEIDAACSPENLAALVQEILSHPARAADHSRWPTAELEKAKRRYIGDLEAGFDDLDGLCGWFGGTELFFRPYSHVERARRVQRVTAKTCRRWPGGCSQPERLTAVAVGPVKAHRRHRRAQDAARSSACREADSTTSLTLPVLGPWPAGAATSTARVTFSLTGLQAASWQMTKAASALDGLRWPGLGGGEGDVEAGGVSVVSSARSLRPSLALSTVTPAPGVSLRVIGRLRVQLPAVLAGQGDAGLPLAPDRRLGRRRRSPREAAWAWAVRLGGRPSDRSAGPGTGPSGQRCEKRCDETTSVPPGFRER